MIWPRKPPIRRPVSRTPTTPEGGRPASGDRPPARGLDAKGAAEAQKDAAAKAHDAAKALDKANTPADAKDALAKAEEAADKLAHELGKEQTANGRTTDRRGQTDRFAASGGGTPGPRAAKLANRRSRPDQQNRRPGEAGKQAAQKAMQQVARETKGAE